MILVLSVTLFLLLCAVQNADGQIRTGWGLTAPCTVNANGSNTIYGLGFWHSCDMWHAPHIANPFLLMVFSRSWIAAFVVSGLFEIPEGIVATITENVSPNASTTANFIENVPDILIDDWLIQAGLGTLLGAWFMWYFKGPAMWGNWYTERGLFMVWLLWYAAIMATQFVFGVNLNGASDPTGFPLGPNICIVLIALIMAFLVQNEPGRTKSWLGRPDSERAYFWMGAMAIYFSFYYVVQFDFFFGSGPQTWLMWAFWIIAIFIWALIRGRGKDIQDLLNWQIRYLRSIGSGNERR